MTRAGRPAAGSRFLGFIELQPQVAPRNAWVALYASFISIGILNFLAFAQPFVLLEVLGLPQARVGRFTGSLATGIELLAMGLSLVAGVLADRVGRRLMYVVGIGLVGAGFAGIVFVQGFADYVLYRVLIGIGSAIIGTMLGLIMVDYPQESSRGKWTGLNAVMNGLGIVLVSLGVSKLPAALEARGLADVPAMQLTIALMAGWCFASAMVFRRGLITGLAGTAPPAPVPLASMLREGIAAARANRGVLLCYLCFLVSRADLAVVATYFTLWVQDYARGQGVPATEAIARAGAMFAMIQGVALLWGPAFGVMLDRYDRVFCAVFALLVAGVGYVTLGLVTDPLAGGTWAICALVGVGQISVLLATQSLIGQESPPGRRGTVMGIATFFGTIGILITAAAGGVLYDLWTPSAPLLVFGAMNLLVLVMAVRVWRGAGLQLGRARASAYTPAP